MITKQEELKRLDELEKKVDEKLTAEKALRLGAEKEVDGLRIEAKRLMSANQDLAKLADKYKLQVDELQHKLDGYGDLAKALGKVRGESVDLEVVRRVVREEVEKLPVGSNPAEGVEVTESVPYLNLKVSSPWLTLDESTLEGRVCILALGGKIPEKFVVPDVIKALEVGYSWRVAGGKQSNRLKEALDVLVGKYKVFERRQQPNGQWQYWLRGDAKSRVKESETREAVEAKE